ncbi:TetR/AcrR family transcriptional regulator [Alteromonas sp. C1M14]|uniref:TetR/AcrR family transcriptional regulator n=1 Tax=Alteromonas sp. C1M14 TaxID=2841567 RepID=UPI001C080081|nr:TetR/AcrR family transcriptional regulator [Alteromonas sp. C1M14]MBU2979604.1 TetR/AcrR family transcriptional regulator [Alteromonas sp. C1M14]
MPKRGPYKAGLERQKQILEAAKNLLIDEGYHNFSIRKVAKRVGISPGNLQHHFATRDDLVSAMLDHVISRYLLELEVIKNKASSPKECLISVIEFVTRDLQTRDTTVFFPEIWSLSNHDEYINTLMQQMYKVYRRIYEDIALQINPSLTEQQGRLIALFISATIEGHTMFIGYKKSNNGMCEGVIKMICSTALQIIESGDIPAERAKN